MPKYRAPFSPVTPQSQQGFESPTNSPDASPDSAITPKLSAYSPVSDSGREFATPEPAIATDTVTQGLLNQSLRQQLMALSTAKLTLTEPRRRVQESDRRAPAPGPQDLQLN